MFVYVQASSCGVPTHVSKDMSCLACVVEGASKLDIESYIIKASAYLNATQIKEEQARKKELGLQSTISIPKFLSLRFLGLGKGGKNRVRALPHSPSSRGDHAQLLRKATEKWTNFLKERPSLHGHMCQPCHDLSHNPCINSRAASYTTGCKATPSAILTRLDRLPFSPCVSGDHAYAHSLSPLPYKARKHSAPPASLPRELLQVPTPCAPVLAIPGPSPHPSPTESSVLASAAAGDGGAHAMRIVLLANEPLPAAAPQVRGHSISLVCSRPFRLGGLMACDACWGLGLRTSGTVGRMIGSERALFGPNRCICKC